MSSTSLLPDNATPLETALERTIVKMLGEIPSPFPALWRPDEAPAAQLPWLAEALGVTEWDSDASESEKRETLKSHWANQRQAGMKVALQRAVEPLGLGVNLKPWYEFGGSPYSFQIELALGDYPLDSAVLSRAEERVQQVKSERDNYSVVIVIESIGGDDPGAEVSAYFRAAFTDLVCADSYPYPNIIVSGAD